MQAPDYLGPRHFPITEQALVEPIFVSGMAAVFFDGNNRVVFDCPALIAPQVRARPTLAPRS